jgi:dTDP-4-dehydro-6-deoxy-alpha-D-glucopyranose 2,3-dehydratase
MIDSDIKGFEFLRSSLTLENEFQDFKTFLSWFDYKARNNNFIVEEIPFDLMEKWYFEHETKNLRHSTGKFFSIEGINVNTNFGFHRKWDQPIIIQPEIGILGIITKVFNGVRYFLMQAKMEPGNINVIQISPTVQATRSNYTKVHEGRLPKYLEYFLDYPGSKVLIDQLQSEQGGRFLKKRNRNMVIEVNDAITVEEDFIWLTLAQIKMALRMDNLVNMDSRSVLSTIPIINDNKLCSFIIGDKFSGIYDLTGKSNSFGQQLFDSAVCLDKASMTFDQVVSWITEMKTKFELVVNRIPLINVVDWKITDYSIEHESKLFFTVIAVNVQAGSREVIQWTQPLLKEKNMGLIGYIVKKINGVLHFLVQAKVEPGTLDVVDLAPTVSCSNYKYILMSNEKPPFIEWFDNPVPESVLFSTIQSEEGGRFFHFQNRNMIIQVNKDEIDEIPENYKWLTLSQLMNLMRFGYLNVESRSLISAICFI